MVHIFFSTLVSFLIFSVVIADESPAIQIASITAPTSQPQNLLIESEVHIEGVHLPQNAQVYYTDNSIIIRGVILENGKVFRVRLYTPDGVELKPY